jgi:phage shock protein PspC (stress-responsive transcriptional regulator)
MPGLGERGLGRPGLGRFGQRPAGSFFHMSIIAPRHPSRLSGQTLLLRAAHQGRIGVEWGVFPIGRPWPGGDAEGMNTTEMNPETSATQTDTQTQTQQLSRPVEGRMLAGVAAGLARYLGVDVTIVRIVLAVLAVIGGAGVPIYIAGWLLIPQEGAEQSLASEFIQSIQSRSR